jgi:regulator of replication initiation timing
MSDCLKELEIKNKMINILQAENKVYRNEQSGWVKEIERRQAKIRELEKLDLNVRELMLENKKLKKENKALRKDKWELEGINEACRKENEAYEGMWEELKKGYSRDGVYFYHDCSDNNDEYVNDVIRELEKKYQQKHYPEVGNE